MADDKNKDQKNTGEEKENKTPEVKENKTENKQEPKETKSAKEETVTVPKSVLEDVLKQVDELKQERETDKKQLERLQYAADKGRLDIFDQRNSDGELIRTEGVSTWLIDDKLHYIIGWVRPMDDVYIDVASGRLVEKQTMKLFLLPGDFETQDGTDLIEHEIPFGQFYKERKMILANVIGERTDKKTKVTSHELELEDGRIIEMGVSFVN